MKNIQLNRILAEMAQKDHIRNIKIYKGSIARLVLATKMTKFDIYSILFAQRSKKQRSNEIRVRSGGMQQYQYMGKILDLKKSRKDPLSLGIIIRNVVDLVSFELNLKIFSPLITNFELKTPKNLKSNFARSNSFFLRRSHPVKAKSEFNYVLTSNI